VISGLQCVGFNFAFFRAGSVGVRIGFLLGRKEALMHLHWTVSGHHILAGLL
jgi:hypothetical protein